MFKWIPAPILSFLKFEVYTAFLVIGTEIVAKNTIKLDWQVVLVAAIVGMVKGAMTWFAGKSK
jgi:hypothetical protein